MTIQPSTKPALLRSDSCSSAEISTHLLTKSPDLSMQTVTPTRRIRFNNQVMVRTTLHLTEISNAEIRKMWYQKDEYRQIRASLAVTVRKIASGKHDGDSDCHCARGLEFRTPYGSQLRRKNKLDALIAVLDEQDRQIDENDLSEEALARLYAEFSHERLQEAQRRGELDHLEASRIYERTESLASSMFNNDDTTGRQAQEDLQKEKRNARTRIGRIFRKGERPK